MIGSANVDFTVALPRLPRVGETVSSGTFTIDWDTTGVAKITAS